MFSLILAAAVAASTPQADDPLKLGFKHFGEDAPLVCIANFEERVRLVEANLPPSNARVIDLYAEKAKLSKDQKTILVGYCDMFDVGIMYAAAKMQQEQAEKAGEHRGLEKPFDDIASFRR